MSNVVRISSHPRFQSGVFPMNEASPPRWHPTGEPAQFYAGRLQGHVDVFVELKSKAAELRDEAFRHRTLGQESVAKLKEEQSAMLLSLVASLPTKLRGP